MISLKRLYVKIITQEGTPECIARGVALGLVIGFLVPIGLQTPPVIVLAFIFKANKVLSWLFTCITNPATVIVIYPIQAYVGGIFLFNPLKFDAIKNDFGKIVKAEDIAGYWDAFVSLGFNIVIPWLVGGAIFALASAIPGYFMSRRLVKAYRARKELRKQKKRMAK